ncbi:hypothetical protein [Albibacterium indicum]|uniref:hypothetical protein n=1 Tax=Albibacterium indicum TaxID=2292082 RepID=UPI000E4D68BE|nr:hypothetical protein [Pedobacter indicus]
MNIRLIRIIIFLCSLVAIDIQAQDRKKISGMVVLHLSDFNDNIKVRDVQVHNLQTNERVSPNNVGAFVLSGKIGDTVIACLTGYRVRTHVIKEYNSLLIDMDSTIQLKEVPILGVHKRRNYEAEKIEYARQRDIYYGGKPPIVLLSPFGGSPITFFRELFSKDARKIRRLNASLSEESQQEEIDLKFNAETVKNLLPDISDEGLQMFLTEYRPDYEQIKKWSDYDFVKYITNNYKEFRKNRE